MKKINLKIILMEHCVVTCQHSLSNQTRLNCLECDWITCELCVNDGQLCDYCSYKKILLSNNSLYEKYKSIRGYSNSNVILWNIQILQKAIQNDKLKKLFMSHGILETEFIDYL